MSELAGLKELINQRFDNLDDRVDALTSQVRETNGRLRKAETDIANLTPRLGTVEREMGEVRNSGGAKSKAATQPRRITERDVILALAVITITVSVLAFLGKLQP